MVNNDYRYYKTQDSHRQHEDFSLCTLLYLYSLINDHNTQKEFGFADFVHVSIFISGIVIMQRHDGSA